MTESKPLILVVEDETPIRRFLKMTLVDHGFDFAEAVNGKEGLMFVASRRPDLLILDLGLPDIDGLAVTRELREWSNVPIIILSARGQEKDKVEALDSGADDYLTKPFGIAELLARIRVALRHGEKSTQGTPDTVFAFGEITTDLVKRQITRGGEEIHLTPIEYKLLSILIKHAGKVVTHNLLLKETWGAGYQQETHYLRVYMAQLRRKLERDSAHPMHLITEPGIGYRLRS